MCVRPFFCFCPFLTPKKVGVRIGGRERGDKRKRAERVGGRSRSGLVPNIAARCASAAGKFLPVLSSCVPFLRNFNCAWVYDYYFLFMNHNYFDYDLFGLRNIIHRYLNRAWLKYKKSCFLLLFKNVLHSYLRIKN